jgi:AraC family transcriptional regulator of adaptative response/methylated-DNA-[protein]-cysteine methyltransferase
MTPNPITDYARVERAIRFLDAHRNEQPSLAAVARQAGLSESHFQRLFTRWAGISPKRFVQHQTAEVLKTLLRTNRSVLDAAYEAGLSGPSRAGQGLTIAYGFHPSPFGECLVATTPHGICHLAFTDPISRREAVDRLRHDWPRATIVADQKGTALAAARAFPAPGERATPGLSIHVKGTNFQLKVWRALLSVPDGETTTYGALAAAIDEPDASRAVGNAVGKNPISWLIPCHRVLRSTGALGGYAWGPDRKRVMLVMERARTMPPARSTATPRALRLA